MTSAQILDLTEVAVVSIAERHEILHLVAGAEAADGAPALDDQVRLDLELSSPHAFRHVLARWHDNSEIVGYAHLDLRSPAVASAHVVVSPAHRRRGIGTAMVRRLSEPAGSRSIRTWSHGDLPGARSFAERLSARRVRELLQMTLPLATPIRQPDVHPGVTVRTFESPGDEDAWVSLNAAAFRDHPEQGTMTVADLEQRERQPWFDPTGLFLAERDGVLVGSHWTKVHVAAAGLPEVGEVYAVGVHPDAQGLGLGKALTLIGLRHLRKQGLDVMLYVDGDNSAAVSMYEKIGFRTSNVDVMYEC